MISSHSIFRKCSVLDLSRSHIPLTGVKGRNWGRAQKGCSCVCFRGSQFLPPHLYLFSILVCKWTDRPKLIIFSQLVQKYTQKDKETEMHLCIVILFHYPAIKVRKLLNIPKSTTWRKMELMCLKQAGDSHRCLYHSHEHPQSLTATQWRGFSSYEKWHPLSHSVEA